MSFATYEGSRTLGEPVDLYQFICGAVTYAYTDGEQPFTFGGVTYEPTPVKRDTVKSSGTLDKSALTIGVARDLAVAELFRIYPPDEVVTLIIRQGHVGDPDSEFLVIWSGRVLSCKFQHSQAQFTCEPVATSMRRTGLRRHYQYGCPHALYMGDDFGGCHANKAAATQTATVTAIAGGTVTLASGWNGARDKTKFLNGMVEWGSTERRTILRVDTVTNTLTLTGLLRDISIGDTISVILGCNHQMDDCATLHSVINDFGGQPWIPTKNPIGFRNQFY